MHTMRNKKGHEISPFGKEFGGGVTQHRTSFAPKTKTVTHALNERKIQTGMDRIDRIFDLGF